MIYLQNPTIPSPTDPIEIDRAIQDLQIKLANSLVWLSHAYPRAYPQIESTQKSRGSFTLPSVYLGKPNNDYKYTYVVPDNDKTAQCFFLVDTETINDFVRGEHNILSYRVSIIFTANLKLVNDVLLATEIFQANLIQQVREVLTREITLTPYDLSISEVSLLFGDVYREFELQNAAVLEKAPFTHFRFECDITLQEECNLPVLNRCDALKNNIQGEDDLICLLSLYDFSIANIQAALSAQQKEDLKPVIVQLLNYTIGFDDDFDLFSPAQLSDLETRLCSCPQPQQYSMLFDGSNERITAQYNAIQEIERTDMASFSFWIKRTVAQTGGVFGKFSIVGTRRGWRCNVLNTGELIFSLVSDQAANNQLVIQANTTIPLNTWTLCDITYTGNSLPSGVAMYLDGSPITTTTLVNNLSATTVNPTAVLEFGVDSNVNFFAGYEFDVRVWKGVVLSAAEIAALYANYMDYDTLYSANVSIRNKMGEGALFYPTFYLLPDSSGYTTSFITTNMEQADRTLDLPPI